jgi:hypothetical protein
MQPENAMTSVLNAESTCAKVRVRLANVSRKLA